MKTFILPFLFLLTFVVSCSTNDNLEALEKNVASYDVYVAGMDNYKACYWKNNIKTDLVSPDSTFATKIIVENNETHVLGKTRTNFNGSYYYWKNNIRQNLGQYLGVPAGQYYQILDMAIDNTDNYFIGYYDTLSPVATEKYAFCIWKNGVKTVLNTSDDIIYTNSKLSVFNHQSYVSATIRVGATFQSGYYINSVFHAVPDISWVGNFAQTSAGINFLYIKNQNYYSRQLSTNTETLVDSNVNPNLSFGKIIGETTSNDQYVIGSVFLNNYYYKNNVQTVFPLDSNYPTIQDMFLLDNNLYLIKQQTTSSASKVYINNVETQSINNTTNLFGSGFNSIFVVAN
ncbi:hypothetical protein SAMN05443633_101192 [Chryseobacterium arachidis]|uniref:DUF4374 domain-containing protein n=1 Tax=Chryseobacterium arachidis TaxID=1416778 RepID=A0A1M4TAC6_9FLAO|nr:hypothetical protein [Chryseobacterium arachidis]SHE41304.1 hypothetical protein SAMN05443633_101192 [Chryseobacterium arachidis]